PATLRQFVAAARRNCGVSAVDVSPGARLIAADTLLVPRLDASEAGTDSARDEGQSAGGTPLPGRVPRSWTRPRGATDLIGLRGGDEYRASEIEELERPEVKADSQVKQVYGAVRRLRP